METQQVGSTIQHKLSWDTNDESLEIWIPEKHIELRFEKIEEDRNCNTKKDKDKRQNRWTAGIFIGKDNWIISRLPILYYYTTIVYYM